MLHLCSAVLRILTFSLQSGSRGVGGAAGDARWRAHRPRALRRVGAEEVAVRRVEQRRDHRQQHGGLGRAWVSWTSAGCEIH